jgi:hypothetical protein
MAKLHEVLAVEADLEGKAKAMMKESDKVFKDKGHLFLGSLRTYQPLQEDGVTYPEEHTEMVTTVPERLDYLGKSIGAWLDAVAQKEATNQVAKADIIVGDDVVAKDVPATMLLGLETRLKSIRAVYVNIPTLDMSKKWQEDEGKGKNVFSAVNPEETFKTAKTMKSKVLHPAQFPKADEGGQSIPAVIDKWDETENVGKYTKQIWCGMITPARKAELIERIDDLLRSVKKARQRANSVEIVKLNIGQTLMNYINK